MAGCIWGLADLTQGVHVIWVRGRPRGSMHLALKSIPYKRDFLDPNASYSSAAEATLAILENFQFRFILETAIWERGNRNSFVAANICEHESNNVQPLSAPTSPPGKNQIFVGHGSAATSDTPAISAPTPSRQTIHFRTPHPQYRGNEAQKKADILESALSASLVSRFNR